MKNKQKGVVRWRVSTRRRSLIKDISLFARPHKQNVLRQDCHCLRSVLLFEDVKDTGVSSVVEVPHRKLALLHYLDLLHSLP